MTQKERKILRQRLEYIMTNGTDFSLTFVDGVIKGTVAEIKSGKEPAEPEPKAAPGITFTEADLARLKKITFCFNALCDLADGYEKTIDSQIFADAMDPLVDIGNSLFEELEKRFDAIRERVK